MKLPKRWLNYSPSGVIDSTRFVAFKVPLPQEYFLYLPPFQRFTPDDLIQMHPDIKLVIDLSFAVFYNERKEFVAKRIQHVKIKTEGRRLATDEQFARFVRVVDDFIAKFPTHGLIGVHCTHGVNRTGYYICRYMIERMGFHPEEAINTFEISRGHKIEREKFTNYLRGLGQSRKVDDDEGDRGDERMVGIV